MTDATGAVVPNSQAAYLPFGDWRNEPSTSDLTDVGYTGHRHNNTASNDLGLIYMNARYYVPGVGRFASADSLVPEPINPQSHNRYSYVHNNPVRYTDSTGHCIDPITVGFCYWAGVLGIALVLNPELLPWNPPTTITSRVTDVSPITSNNMTSWLRNQMVTNAQSAVTAAIRENWESWNPIKKDGALQAFAALIGTDARWDFKYDIRETDWYQDGERNVILGNRTLNYDAIANMHFGFVGRAAGFDGEFLVAAAGLAQWQRWQETGSSDDEGVCDLTYYCDHPFATWSVRFGIYLYDLYGDNLDALDDVAFTQALDDYIDEYGEPPDPPPGALAP